MAFTRFRKLRLERLETRDVPSDLGVSSFSPPTYSSSMAFIDPTLAPSNPTGTSVQVTIIAVGAPAPGTQNVTVTGLTASNLQAGASLVFYVGGSAYTVNSYSLNQDGSVRLTLNSDANLANLLSTNSTATVVIGGGGNVTPTPAPAPAPSSSPIIDPTLNPQG
jgi:hypothetical protein